METVTVLLLVAVLALVSALGVLMLRLYRRSQIEARDIEPAISKAWRKSGLDEKMGQLTAHARDIRESYASIEQMLRVPKERASLGELSLEAILSDQLPPDMYAIRSRVFDGKTPDAYIKSTVGLICIDSKFPLDNYREMVQATEAKDSERFKRQFVRDVRGHLEKISVDYVRPENGSSEFAFAYIPSEGVYHFLVCEAYDTLREYTGKGVQVASPLTLSHKIELIKTGVHARKLSEDAERVRSDLIRLSRRFQEVDQVWRVFYQTHFRNAGNKAEDLDRAYKELRTEFSRIASLSSLNDQDPTEDPTGNYNQEQ